MRRLVALLLLLLAVPMMPARAQDVLTPIRAGNWAAADEAASHWADPVARKLVAWYRLQAPGGGSAGEIDAFLQSSPDWPNQGALARARELALATEPEQASALALCDGRPLTLAVTLLRCADAYAAANRAADAGAALRAAWIGTVTDLAGEQRLLARAGDAIGPEENWRRFDRLLSADHASLARQIARLDGVHRQAAEAVAAMRRNQSDTAALVAALPASFATDPTILLEQVRWLHRTGNPAAAATLLLTNGEAAQKAAARARLPGFWTERHLLAREALRAGDNATAYALVATHGQADPELAADAEFLAGWIALRRLNQPKAALPHFTRLTTLSRAVITQGRAHYWIARADAAAGDTDAARNELATAAAWPTTYYGQLAALALGDEKSLEARIVALHDPVWDQQQALEFAGREVARAASLLAAWGDADRARPFLLRLEDLAPDAPARAMAARLAMGFGLQDQAVAIARRAGRDGVMLPDLGWPQPIEPPSGQTEAALTLGIMRQESNFNPGAVSPAGARGLMQLMPATARALARKFNERINVARLTADIGTNMRLGTLYLGQLMDQFAGAMPMAIAAYNAGPGRVQQWAAENGDPRGATDMVDWIELIPFDETRNYVQRVIENVVIYRVRRGKSVPHPVVLPVLAPPAPAEAARG